MCGCYSSFFFLLLQFLTASGFISPACLYTSSFTLVISASKQQEGVLQANDAARVVEPLNVTQYSNASAPTLFFCVCFVVLSAACVDRSFTPNCDEENEVLKLLRFRWSTYPLKKKKHASHLDLSSLPPSFSFAWCTTANSITIFCAHVGYLPSCILR